MNRVSLKTIHISGPDAASFLQNLITCQMNDLKEKPIFSAACNQKGRIIANFWIWRTTKQFYLQLPTLMVDTLLMHFKTYLFRSTVQFEVGDTLPPSKPDFMPIWVLPETTATLIPQMIGMEKQGGVSFKKGCYLGQEIIARTEHLGKLKRHLQHFTLDKAANINIGDEITNKKNEKVGILVAVSNDTIFAVIEDHAAREPLYWKNQRIGQIAS